MKTSESVDQIAAAFAAAQGAMSNPGFDSENPHFKNKFASLASVRNAIVPPLAAQGISIAQELTNIEGGVSCLTRLTHASGQWMEFGPFVMPYSKADAQGLGSAATYCKRYHLMAVVCVAGDIDDDANEAAGKASPPTSIHHPKGDLGKQINPDQAMATATAMRGILELDVDEKIKALKVFDKHDILNRDPDLYVAASDQLAAKEKSAWKAYIAQAKRAETEDRQIANAGRKF